MIESMNTVAWEIFKNGEGLFDIRNSNGISLQAARDLSNLNQQLEANGFSEAECLEVHRQLSETRRATISVQPLPHIIRHVNLFE